MLAFLGAVTFQDGVDLEPTNQQLLSLNSIVWDRTQAATQSDKEASPLLTQLTYYLYLNSLTCCHGPVHPVSILCNKK